MTKTEVNRKIEAITKKIVKEYQPEKIILFGSWASGKPTKDSDVDLFIVKETANTRQTAQEIDGFLWGRTIPVDIIVYTPRGIQKNLQKGNFFIKDIINNGKVIYERSRKRIPTMA